jgi:hypothetical protein
MHAHGASLPVARHNYVHQYGISTKYTVAILPAVFAQLHDEYLRCSMPEILPG